MTIFRQYVRSILNAKTLLVYSFLLGFLLYMVTPFLIIFVNSFGKGWYGMRWLPQEWTLNWYKWAIDVADVPQVMTNTLVIAGIAVVISTLIALPTGWALGRRHIPSKELLTALILLPRMIPAITFALGVAKIFYGLQLVDTYLGVALAHVALAAPYAILVLSATFESLDERVLEASAVCGASPVQGFFYVILPLILPGILSSIIFTFTTSYNEFTMTLMTYGPHTMTLPVRTYLAVGEGYWEVSSALAVILIIPSLFILFFIQRQLQPEKLVGGFKGV
jgi:putative spermidine/putrescine transport system permease protein